MAKINRIDADVQAFASEALAGERTVFDSSTESDDLNDNLNASFRRGFGVYGPTDFPTLEDFNGMGFTISQLNAYLYQAGVPEWSSAQEYYKGSFCNVDGFIYVSNIDNNTNNNPLLSTGGEVGLWTDTLETEAVALNAFDKLIPLNSVNFVLADTSTAQVYSYINGGGYTAIGSSFSLPLITGNYDFCAVDDDKFALIDNTGLTMFSVDIITGTIAQLGNKLPIATTSPSDVSCSQLFVNDGNVNRKVYVFFGDTSEIKEYEFDGTDFVDNGVKFTTTATSGVITELNRKNLLDSLAFLDNTDNVITALRYNTTTDLLEQVGNEFDTTSVEGLNDSISYLSDNVILGLASNDAKCQAISFANNLFVSIGSLLDLSTEGADIPSIAPLSQQYTIIADEANDLLRAFENVVGTGDTPWTLLPSSSIGFNPAGTGLSSTNVSDAIKEVLQVAYHVGSYWMSDDPTSPLEALGFGVWERVEGRFLVGVDDNDSDFALGETGGTKSHEHFISGQTQNAFVGFSISIDGWGSTQQNGALPEPTTFGRLVTGSGKTENAEALESLGHANNNQVFPSQGLHSHSFQGNTTTSSNLPPYYATYIWRRIA